MLIFQRPQIALALRARAILLVFVYLFQIALEIMWLIIQIPKIFWSFRFF